jgi:hypothetical protein
MMVMTAVPSELLGLEQRVGQIHKQRRGNEAGQGIIEDHGGYPSEQVAGIDISERHGEKDEPDRQHDDIHHGNAPDLRMLESIGVSKCPLAARTADLHQKRNEFPLFTCD